MLQIFPSRYRKLSLNYLRDFNAAHRNQFKTVWVYVSGFLSESDAKQLGSTVTIGFHVRMTSRV